MRLTISCMVPLGTMRLVSSFCLCLLSEVCCFCCYNFYWDILIFC